VSAYIAMQLAAGPELEGSASNNVTQNAALNAFRKRTSENGRRAHYELFRYIYLYISLLFFETLWTGQ